MYCAKCEFEIKGEGRKECPICGGPLIDFSSLASETPEDIIDKLEDQPTENSQETSAAPTFDPGNPLNDDDKVSEKGLEPEAPPAEQRSTENFEQPTFEKTGEAPETSTSESEKSIPFDLESALTVDEEKPSPEPETGQKKEDLFTFQTALNEDEVKQNLESEEPAQISSSSEHKPEPEPPLEELSTEELLRRIAEEYKPAEKDVEEELPAAVVPRGPKPAPARSSRSISAIAALAVFSLMAAIASIAYLTPQEKLHPTIVNLKTETEKKINEITDLVIINVEKYLYEQEPSPRVPQQKTRTDRRAKKISLAKKRPVQEKRVPVETKPPVVNKIVPAENKKPAPKEPAQPQVEAAKDIPPSPQEKPSPQIVEEKVKAPVKPTGTKSAKRNLYSLHTGSFTKESIASAEAERLKKMGFNSYIQKVSLKNGQTWYRIKVGDFNTRNEAKDIQDKLKKKAPHIKAYVMKKRVPAKAPVTAETATDPKSVTEKPQEAVESIEEVSSPEETVAAEAEHIIPELRDTPEIPQTMVEIPQEAVDSAEEIASAEEAMTGEEEIIAGKGYNPYTQEAKEETYHEDNVSIETLPRITPEQEDQASATIHIFPETAIQKGQEVITPTE